MLNGIQDRASKHKINLKDSRPSFQNEYGNIQRLTTDELSMLKNLGLEKVELERDAVLEPKWFVNCNAIAYVIEGKVLVRMLDHGSEMSAFTVAEGQMFHIRSGALFTVENVIDSKVTLLFCTRHEHPKEFTLSASAGAFTDAVLGNTWNVEPEVFAKLPRTTSPRVIVKREGPAQIPENAHWPSPNRFDVEDMQAPTYAEGVGSAKKARSQYWKILTNIAMYSLRVEDQGMREPHWHPDTVELGFIREGNARMSIMDPDGSVDTFLLHPGDVYFIPANYPHQIEVIGQEKIHFLIFFDQPMPKDVGFRQAGHVMSRRIMAAAFGVKEIDLPEFPYENEDPLLVVKRNAVDPVI